MLLRAFILNKAGLSTDHPAGAGAARRLLIFGRQNKEDLFSDGAVTVELGDRDVEVTLREFLEHPEVAQFGDRLRERSRRTVEVAVACARDFQRTSRRRTPVSFLLTDGGHDLPMVKAIAADPGISWHYEEAKPHVAANAEELDFYNIYRQLAVAIGTPSRNCPRRPRPCEGSCAPSRFRLKRPSTALKRARASQIEIGPFTEILTARCHYRTI